MAYGFVSAVEALPAEGRGRPAAAFNFNPGIGSILTAHVGMTGMRLGIADLAAKMYTHTMRDINVADGPESLCAQLIDAFEAMLADQDIVVPPTFGIGVGLPGRIELAGIPDVGKQWTQFPIASRLGDHFGVPCRADRDVNLLALGEQVARHASKGVHICVKVGSAIGCGVAIDGQVVSGAAGLAGEIGHTRVMGRSDPCSCGNRGCLNAVASGSALVAQIRTAGHDVDHVRDVVELSNSGVAEATEVIREAGRNIGQVLAGCVNLLNPMDISLWGYLLGAEETLVAGIREALAAYAAPASTRDLAIESTEHGDTTGLRGAARLVTEYVLSPTLVDRRLTAADERTPSAAS